METKRVPNLDWPRDLFRGPTAGDVIDDPENPFLEDSDFTSGIRPAKSSEQILLSDYALAE
jgi:hypothetical protein